MISENFMALIHRHTRLVIATALLALGGTSSMVADAQSCKINSATDVGISVGQVREFGSLRVKYAGGKHQEGQLDMKAPSFEQRGIVLEKGQSKNFSICGQEVTVGASYIFEESITLSISVF